MAVNAPQLAIEMTNAMGYPLPASTELEAFATGLLNGLTGGVATTGPASGNTISGIVGPSIAAEIASLIPTYSGVSTELNNFCTAYATYVMASAIVTYTGPGTPSYFTGGTISGLIGAALAATIQSTVGYPFISTKLLAMSTAIVDHIIANAEVESGVIS